MYDTATNPMALRDFRTRLHGELIFPGRRWLRQCPSGVERDD